MTYKTRPALLVPRLLLPGLLAPCLLVLAACAHSPKETGPDCTPMVANVQLLCWYGGVDQPLSQCEVARENPVGCGLGPDAVAHFNSGLDLSPIFKSLDGPDRPRWVQITAYRNAEGRIGRRYFPSATPNDNPIIYKEKPFVPR